MRGMANMYSNMIYSFGNININILNIDNKWGVPRRSCGALKITIYSKAFYVKHNEMGWRRANKRSNKKCITLNAVKFHGAFISSELVFRGQAPRMKIKAHSICARDLSICTHAYVMRVYFSRNFGLTRRACAATRTTRVPMRAYQHDTVRTIKIFILSRDTPPGLISAKKRF